MFTKKLTKIHIVNFFKLTNCVLKQGFVINNNFSYICMTVYTINSIYPFPFYNSCRGRLCEGIVLHKKRRQQLCISNNQYLSLNPSFHSQGHNINC